MRTSFLLFYTPTWRQCKPPINRELCYFVGLYRKGDSEEGEDGRYHRFENAAVA